MTPKATILLVEDDRENSLMLREALTRRGYSIVEAPGGEEALAAIQSSAFDLVLSDIRMGRVDGLQVLRAVHRDRPETPVILMTGFGSIDTAVEAVRAGAFDYISKPFKLDEIQVLLERALEERRLQLERKAGVAPGPSDDDKVMVGHSRAMAEVYKLVARLAASRATVLIEGESGTGKELVAHAIHRHSDRSQKPFIAINCAALPETLLESELFGYAQGAHSTATTSKPGVFEQAQGGVLFLDEVGDMSLALQAKLLRILENAEARPVGGTRSIHVDVRVIAATNKDLDALVASGQFRADLLYRLKVVTLRMPPLRERKEDIPALVRHFLRKYSARRGGEPPEASPRVLETLVAHDWPGNVRELENVIERAVTLNAGSRLDAKDLPPGFGDRRPAGPGPNGVLSLAETERRHILSVLEQTRGNIKAAAELLGIDRKTLYRKLAEYEVKIPRT